jgi:hypothetical protein
MLRCGLHSPFEAEFTKTMISMSAAMATIWEVICNLLIDECTFPSSPIDRSKFIISPLKKAVICAEFSPRFIAFTDPVAKTPFAIEQGRLPKYSPMSKLSNLRLQATIAAFVKL